LNITLFQIVIGAIGAAIAFSVFRLSQRTREDTWLRTLWDYQRSFWQDSRMEEVRTWIACDAAYEEELKPILKKRKAAYLSNNAPSNAITKDEYKHLETIDRFAALLMGYRKISPMAEYSTHRAILHRMFFHYWLTQASSEKRSELSWYLHTFYSELFDDASQPHQLGWGTGTK